MIKRVLRSAGRQALDVAESLVSWTPGGIGYHLRRRFYGARFAALGSHAGIGMLLAVSYPERIRIGAHFTCWRLCSLIADRNGQLEIGDRVSLSEGVKINASDGVIVIGDDVMIGPNVVLRSANHGMERLDIPMNAQPQVGGLIEIGNDVWIGANATLVAGARLGAGSVVAAGAVVRTPFPPFSVLGGVPATLIRNRQAVGEGR